MKKKLILSLLALISTSGCVLGLSACSFGGGHTHNYQWVDNGDGTHRQHCINSGCSAPDLENSEHYFDEDNGRCIYCNAENPDAVVSAALTFDINSDGNSYSVSYNGNTHETQLKIPSEYRGKLVTRIGASMPLENISSIIIPDSITAIDEYALQGRGSLSSITVESGNPVYHSKDNCLIETASKSLILGCKNSVIPADGSVTIIGKAFSYCTSLTNIIIPDCVTSIDSKAFVGCNELESITLPFIGAAKDGTANTGFSFIFGGQIPQSLKTVIITTATSIDEGAINSCSGLTNITIPDSVTHIGNGNFYGCDALTSITVSENNTVYASQDGILYNKAKTEILHIPASISGAITIPEGVTSIGNTTDIGNSSFQNCDKLTSVIIPNTVTYIGNNAFHSCSELISIDIPDNVTKIGDSAFHSCSKLISIDIPDSVLDIGNNVFDMCTSLTGITVSENNLSYASQDGILYNKNKTEFIFVPLNLTGDITIPDGIKSIPSMQFYNRTEITSITIPDSVTSIEESAFSYCNGLTSITIPYSVTSIGDRAFSSCKGLTNVNISAYFTGGVTKIGKNAFGWCSSLTSITLPSTLKSISENAFFDCNELTGIYFEGTISGWCEIDNLAGLMTNGKTDKKLYMRGGTEEVTGEIEIPQGVTRIPPYAFYNCIAITGLNIRITVTDIGDNAFYGCSGITQIHFDGWAEQWATVTKGNDWNGETGVYTITFADQTTINKDQDV